MSEKMTMQGGKLAVPDNPVVPYIEGDGTGPDITRAAVTVKNTGARTGDEIVRFYLTARGTRIQRPWRELIDFVRVTLRPDESKRVFGEVREEFVGHFGRDGKFVPPSASCVYRFSADGCFMPPPTGLSYNPDKGFTWENPSDCVNNTWHMAALLSNSRCVVFGGSREGRR